MGRILIFLILCEHFISNIFDYFFSLEEFNAQETTGWERLKSEHWNHFDFSEVILLMHCEKWQYK